MFWVFLPVVLLLVFSLALGFQYMPQFGKLVSFGLCMAGVLLLHATYDAVRFGWAIRTLGALVFCAYAFYLMDELRQGHQFRLAESRSTASPRKAVLGLLVFGISGLIIALRPTRDRTLLETLTSHESADGEPALQDEEDDKGGT